ncbi:MAG: TraB/GumN family protein [Alphaproteobacteria bacterium]|nr:TraB/GumN family protein [Alphaproteobacteria bacterium]
MISTLMRRVRSALAIGAAAAAFALASTAPAAARAADISPALFVVRDEDSTLYLFGTMHIRPAGAPWGGANAVAALEEADEIWLETVEQPEDLALALRYAISAEPISATLTPEQYARLNAALESVGQPAGAFDMMRPWFAALMLELMPMIQRGYDIESGADMQIQARANARGIPVRALETSEQHLRILADLETPLQVRLLMETIEAIETGGEESQALERAWEQGDLERIAATDLEELRTEMPDFYDILLVRRNAAWVETIERELAGAGVDLFAVGAAHLAGEHSVQAMLEARGYTVERVAAAAE